MSYSAKKLVKISTWILLSYASLLWLHMVLGSVLALEENAFFERATGPYAWAFWLMFICAMVLPYILLYKPFSKHFLYVIFIAIAINIGGYLEQLTLLLVEFHRDYLPPTYPKQNSEPPVAQLLYWYIGFSQYTIIGSLAALFFTCLLQYYYKNKGTNLKEE